MISDEEDYVKALADSISDAFDGNWCNDNMGQVEGIWETQQLLVNGVSIILALLVNRGIIDIKILRNLLKDGWQIKGDDE